MNIPLEKGIKVAKHDAPFMTPIQQLCFIMESIVLALTVTVCKFTFGARSTMPSQWKACLCV